MIPEIEKYFKVLVEVNKMLCSVLIGKHSYGVKFKKASFFSFKPSSIKTFLKILINICSLYWKETGNSVTHYIREPRQKNAKLP